MDEDDDKNIFSWRQTAYVLTEDAIAYWDTTGRGKMEAFMAKRQAEKYAVDRLVIIQPISKETDRKAGMLVRVIRETEKRLYIETVHKSDTGVYTFNYITGSGRGSYVSKRQVWMDGVTKEQYLCIVSVEDRIVADKKKMRLQREDELDEVRQKYVDRFRQKEAEYDDMLLDVLNKKG